MPKKKPNEYAQDVLSNDDYLKKILDKIDGDDKDVVLSRLGERIMAKDDYSRGQDELRTKEQANLAYKNSLDEWYQDKLGVITEGQEALKKLKTVEGQPGPSSQALASLEGYVKKEDAEKIVEARLKNSEEISLAILTQMGNLIGQHQHLYKEPLDTAELISFARGKGLSLVDAYNEKYAEKAAARRADIEKAEREKLKADLRAELQKEMGHGAYPIAADEPSTTLSALGFKRDAAAPSPYGVQAAVEEFHKMRQGK